MCDASGVRGEGSEGGSEECPREGRLLVYASCDLWTCLFDEFLLTRIRCDDWYGPGAQFYDSS